MVPVLSDIPTLSNGRALAIRKDLQNFLSATSSINQVNPRTIAHAFREFGLSELLESPDYEDSADLFDLIMQHLLGTLSCVSLNSTIEASDATAIKAVLTILLVIYFFQVCASRSVKITLDDLRVIATVSRVSSQVKQTVKRIFCNAEICVHSVRTYLDGQGRRLVVEDDGCSDAIRSVSTGRAVKAVIQGRSVRLLNADTLQEIFNERFLHVHELYNELFPLLKDISTLMPPPMHNPFGGSTPSGSPPGSVTPSEAGSQGRRKKAGPKNLAYKLNK
jgi:hypothetical protein